MKYFKLLSLITLLFFYGCKSEEKNVPDPNLIIGGSDTEYEIVDLLLQNFHQTHQKKIDIQGGGSGLGIQQLLNEEIQMANSSRKINSHELDEANDKNINLREIVFAYDALAIICHPNLGIDSLSTIELSQIFKGEIKNWKEIGGKDLPINIYGRDVNSGTRRYIENRFVRNEGFSNNYIETAGNKEIIEKVKKDKGGIGFVGVGYIMNEYGMPANDVWALPIYTEGSNAFSPYETIAIMNKDYDLVRPLYQYINEKHINYFSEFINFELSDKGQELVKQYGFYQIDEEIREINRKNGF